MHRTAAISADCQSAIQIYNPGSPGSRSSTDRTEVVHLDFNVRHRRHRSVAFNASKRELWSFKILFVDHGCADVGAARPIKKPTALAHTRLNYCHRTRRKPSS